MIHKKIFLFVFLIVFVNIMFYLIPTFAPSVKRTFILPYQLWFMALVIFLVFLPHKKTLIHRINKN